MARTRGGGRRRRGHHEEESEERWLLTYADMITLLMALFMVLFSISSVNTSKFESLQRALQDAFSGRILPGGESVQNHGSSTKPEQPSPEPPLPALKPLADTQGGKSKDKAETKEDENFKELQKRLEAYAKRHGLADQVEVTIARRGLVIKLLTDKVLFDSGEAVLKPGAEPLLAQVAGLVKVDDVHPVMVEGHTDNVPIRGAFPSNWELSTARASAVVRFLLRKDVPGMRLGAAGFAALHPVDSNSSAEGRARNRRVEIVLLRTGQAGNDPAIRPGSGAEGSDASADDPFRGVDEGEWTPVPADDADAASNN